jgi:hypothetical protein
MNDRNGVSVDKLVFINNLILNTLKYVNNYSEFIGNSISLNWLKFIDGSKKDRYLEKVLNNIDKLKKIESKQVDNKFIQEIIISNLLFINKYKNQVGNKISAKMMAQIQEYSNLNSILTYLINEYLTEYKSNVVNINQVKNSFVKTKSNKVKTECTKDTNYYVLDKDKNGEFYLHIKFNRNIMMFDNNSFDYEYNQYIEKLANNEKYPFFTDAGLKYSTFEKKRRIYIKSMYDLDKTLNDLSSKNIDIIYPVDKVFSCALEIVDNIYKEVVNYNDEKSVLNNLMNLTIEKYGSLNKVIKFQELVYFLEKEIRLIDDSTRKEILNFSNSIIIDKGYKEFRNISNIFPNKKDLYIAANEKISLYVKKNIKTIITNLSVLSLYTKYMEIDEILNLYFDMKNVMFENRIKSNVFIELQKCLYLLIKDKTNFSDDEIFNTYFKEVKMFDL